MTDTWKVSDNNGHLATINATSALEVVETINKWHSPETGTVVMPGGLQVLVTYPSGYFLHAIYSNLR